MDYTRKVSSKDMSESEFNKLIYEIQKEYGIKKCSLGKRREIQNEIDRMRKDAYTKSK